MESKGDYINGGFMIINSSILKLIKGDQSSLEEIFSQNCKIPSTCKHKGF